MPTAPRKPGSRVNSIYHAPYEEALGANREHRTAVGPQHGGYGILVDGYLHGPFFYYEVAVRCTAKLTGRSGHVARWVDFCVDSSRQPEFRKRLATLVAPLTFPIYGPNQLAPAVWPAAPSTCCK